MKTITLKSRWIDQTGPVTREEYPAGWSGEVSNDRAERAERAGVLVEPEIKTDDAPITKPSKATD